MSTEDAVSAAIKMTAGVVTSAAIVMVGVFAIFGTLSFMMFKQMGVGLAFAVLLDATLVRGVLLPSTMKLLGEPQLVAAPLAGLAPRRRAGARSRPPRRPDASPPTRAAPAAMRAPFGFSMRSKEAHDAVHRMQHQPVAADAPFPARTTAPHLPGRTGGAPQGLVAVLFLAAGGAALRVCPMATRIDGWASPRSDARFSTQVPAGASGPPR